MFENYNVIFNKIILVCKPMILKKYTTIVIEKVTGPFKLDDNAQLGALCCNLQISGG